MHNPHYDGSGVAYPSVRFVQAGSPDAPPAKTDYCRRCLKDVCFDTVDGRLVARNPDWSLHPCEGA